MPVSPRPRPDRSLRLRIALALLLLAALGTSSPASPAEDSAVPHTLAVPVSPGSRVPGLQYFHLTSSPEDTVFRLLVIPVRFPEDRILGGGSREDLQAKLTGSLSRYYLDQTGNRLRMECILAPTVTARYARDYYTVQGGGYGTDPRSYPHNAQGLVAEVTEALNDVVDFRLFDNTRDDIADGLLVLHSGPVSVEAPGSALDPDVLLAHAFTLPAPVERGGSLVFPYAIAATRDAVGVWAHEAGHLLGLVDLYVASGICPGPGLGEWSLMATGANRAGGSQPTGLDAYSRQLLGLGPVFDTGAPVDLSGGAFLRVSDPGAELGPRYYLVEARAAGDGPAGKTPARVVYFVDEDAVDNRSCEFPADSYRPLVRLAAVVCPGETSCVDTFQEGCPDCPSVLFAFEDALVRVGYGTTPEVRLSRIALGNPRMTSGTGEQKVLLSLENVDRAASRTVTLQVVSTVSDSTCVLGPVAWDRTLGPGESTTDSTLALAPCSLSGRLPREDVTLVLRSLSTGSFQSRVDTLVLPAAQVGVSSGDSWRFTIRNLNPGRRVPWTAVVARPGGPCPPDCPPALRYVAENFDRLAHGELLSPWFTVPENGRLVLSHDWDLSSLSPDVALDAGQIRLRTLTRPDRALSPPLGWGYTAERSIGNALGGSEVLSAEGGREYVFDLREYPGEVARLVFVAAGDAELSEGRWDLSEILVRAAPTHAFALEEDPRSPGTLLAVTASAPAPGILLHLFRGRPGVSPTTEILNLPWTGDAETVLGRFQDPESRFELLWSDSTGSSDAQGAVFDLPVLALPRFLLAPSPNPVRRNATQTWSVQLSDDGPPGIYELRLFRVDGGSVARRSLRIDVPGKRLILWDGRDEEGRTISSGIYFLEGRRPDGATNGQRVVVIP